ncbi:RNA polymerase sigma-70 factor (ECF subfamily) [Flavobacterium araucananum]|uniref:RNA polymerase subunit sigma-70 n=1 Tax=Flavobacterium araucananum TaxID=946678 RepID=A0A227P6Q7_9FLAO|nr:RNA polymerase sigma-70 factor [Flavobacterium araucananum]OXG05084.1 RNA polymerase subunit sigma-70 [Flavobacterium araucananum]PWJ96799.1 RNA polymerase sigma-70 factor (ECF subfamily) [Flavobacterium araucananum]
MNKDHSNTVSDDVLLKHICLHDDHGSFTMLYDRYWNKALAIAYNLTKDKSVAKDIVQDVFISFWNRRTTLEINNFDSYLATSLKFSVFSHFEKERRRRIIREEKLEIKQEAILDEQIESMFTTDYFSNLLEHLPEKCKLVVQYSRIEDMKNAEIAKTMNISEKTVEGHLTKGLKIIRNKFRY